MALEDLSLMAAMIMSKVAGAAVAVHTTSNLETTSKLLVVLESLLEELSSSNNNHTTRVDINNLTRAAINSHKIMLMVNLISHTGSSHNHLNTANP